MDSVDSKENNDYFINENKLCYIINNEEFDPKLNLSVRSGTQRDFEKLKALFRKLGFTVENHKNCTADMMLKNLEEISQRKNLKDYSMFVCFILSHGDEGIIYGRDNFIQIDRLLGYFKGDKCKGLVGKPKLFFIQACRGDRFDKGIFADAGDSNNIEKIPIEADILVGYSTVPACHIYLAMRNQGIAKFTLKNGEIFINGMKTFSSFTLASMTFGYFSWRNSSNGSWYVQALCNEFEKNAKSDDVVSLLVRVNANVASNFKSNTGEKQSHGKLQIPSFTCMLRKRVWLIEDHK